MKHKKLLIFLIFIVILASFFVFLLRQPAGVVSPDEIKWGAAFSKSFAIDMGLNWQEAYLAILGDLKPYAVRLPIYWQDVEPQSGIYDFADYDWMVSEAQKRGVKLILVIGRKVPRWPECHFPNWALSLNGESQQTRLLKLLPEIINRYKNYDNLYLWQVENEPFLSFGECPTTSGEFLQQEIDLVRRLDLGHKILVTDSGEISPWLRAARYGDIFGTTMYRIIWNEYVGHFEYPLPPKFFWLKANLVHLFSPGKEIIVSELQGEPWGPKMPYETPLEDQFKSMNLAQFNKNIVYAQQVGFPEIYLWGAEWWYWLKTAHNQPEIWEAAKSLINE